MSDGPGYDIRPLQLAETYELRRRVLRNNDPGAEVHIREDDRSDAWHIGAIAGGRVIATASFYGIPCRQRPDVSAVAQLRMMAVDERWQETGVGRAVLRQAMEHLRNEGIELLWCNARSSAAGFYEHLGFELIGDPFIETVTGLLHQVAIRDLVTQPLR